MDTYVCALFLALQASEQLSLNRENLWMRKQRIQADMKTMSGKERWALLMAHGTDWKPANEFLTEMYIQTKPN
jgi:hypothetical protein